MASSSTRMIALVTGAASGLGRATAERFVKQKGAKVILCDLESSDGYDVAKSIAASGSTNTSAAAVFVPTDVTQPDDITNALNVAEQQFGGVVNTLVNCAGIGIARKTLSSKGPHDIESFERVLNINVTGTFNTIRLTSQRMIQGNPIDDHGCYGVIVNTASIAAYDGQIGQAAYAASKGAIVGMTLPIARDLSSYGIRVNTIAPGLFQTPLLEALPEQVQNELGNMVPFPKRLGYPSEFAQLVESIVDNPMMNGEVIRLDGALRMPPK